MKVLALTKYSYEGPSSRYRFYNYQNYFISHGIEMEINPLFDKNYFHSKNKQEKLKIALKSYISRMMVIFSLLVSKNRYDLILLEYELLPYFPAIFEKLFNLRGIKYIVDYDDAIFHKYDMSNNPLIKLLLKDKIPTVIKNATHCIACNDYLESYIKKYNTNILRLPTVVLLDRYIQAYDSYERKNDDRFIIGWIGSRTTSIYILELLDVFKMIIERYPTIEFNLVGFDEGLLSTKEIKEHHINIIQWSEKKEIEDILDFDIGIMPLTDDPWSQGKCGFKLVQYMSCKKPVIASPVGINCALVTNGENGYLVQNTDEWFNALEELYLDKDLRETMSKNNFKKILKEFNYEKNFKRYIKLLKQSNK